MAKLLLVLMLTVQLAQAQFSWVLRQNFDLTHPSVGSSRFAPSYDTWSNHYALGLDFNVTLIDPVYWSASVDYTHRAYELFDHPYGGTEPTYGGDGSLWRFGLSAGVRTPIITKSTVFAQVGIQIQRSHYSPVYYELTVWDYPEPLVEQAQDPSTTFAVPMVRTGIEYNLFESVGLVGAVSAIRNRDSGYFFQASFGIGTSF